MELKRGEKRLVRAKVEDINGLQNQQETVTLSSFDISAPKVPVRVIYAYELPESKSDSQVDNASKLLEDGLARTLVEYKEYAGRLSEDLNGRPTIALNGQGAAWFDAEASVTLRDLMAFSPGDDLLQLVPPDWGAEELLLVQFTRFKCGGFTLAVSRHHWVADGTSVSAFMLAWASVVRGESIMQSPLHDRSALMARCEVQPQAPQPRSEAHNGKQPRSEAHNGKNYYVQSPPTSLKCRKLHFSPELLKKVKTEAVRDLEEGSYFTTVESLTAHLWRSIIRAQELTGEVKCQGFVSVNARDRLEKKLPDNYFGNVIFRASAMSSAGDLTEKPLSYAAGILRKAIKGVDSQYIAGALEYMERTGHMTMKSPAAGPRFSMTSWVRFPLYQTDFGWGKPLLVGPPSSPLGTVILVPSYTQDGSIDVITTLSAPHMEKLEQYVFEI